MQLRLFPSPQKPIGHRLAALVALPDVGCETTTHGSIDLAATDDPLMAAELASGFVGKLPVWLDLDGDPATLARLNRAARRAIARADVVTVATRGLWEMVRETTLHVFLVPEPVPTPPAPPPGTTPLLRPAIGWYGIDDSHLRLDLLIEIALAARDHQIYFGGPAAAAVDKAAATDDLPNFHLLPEADATLWRRLSIAVFPFPVGKETETWLPTGLLAALASGTPVVSTPLLEPARLDAPIAFAVDGGGFAARVAEILADPEQTALRAKQGREFIAREHAPQAVAARLCRALASVN